MLAAADQPSHGVKVSSSSHAALPGGGQGVQEAGRGRSGKLAPADHRDVPRDAVLSNKAGGRWLTVFVFPGNCSSCSISSAFLEAAGHLPADGKLRLNARPDRRGGRHGDRLPREAVTAPSCVVSQSTRQCS